MVSISVLGPFGMIPPPDELNGVTRGGAFGGAGQPASKSTHPKMNRALLMFSCGRAERSNMRRIVLTNFHRTRSNRFSSNNIDMLKNLRVLPSPLAVATTWRSIYEIVAPYTGGPAQTSIFFFLFPSFCGLFLPVAVDGFGA